MSATATSTRAPGKTKANGSVSPSQRRASIQARILERVTDEVVDKVVDALVAKAQAGDVMAARELLDRAIGKAKQAVELEAPPPPKHWWEKHPSEMSEDELVASVIRGNAWQTLQDNVLRRKIEGIISGYPDLPPNHPMRLKARRIMALVHEKRSSPVDPVPPPDEADTKAPLPNRKPVRGANKKTAKKPARKKSARKRAAEKAAK